MSTRTAVLVLVAFSLVGVILTLIAGQEPGTLLGFFIVVGAVVAALGIRPGRVYLLFPAPVLAFFVAAIVTGKVHDAKLGSSTASLATGFLQWIAGIFIPAVAATILVILIGGGRWLLDRQLVTGHFSLSTGAPAPRNARPSPKPGGFRDDEFWPGGDVIESPAPRPRQGSGPRPQQGTGPRPQQGTGPRPQQGSVPRPQQGSGPRPQQGTGPRPPRPSRDLDPWGDPRSQPNGNGARPRVNGRPAPQAHPRPPRPQPNQPAPAPSFNPAPRPPRRQPPDGWTQR